MEKINHYASKQNSKSIDFASSLNISIKGIWLKEMTYPLPIRKLNSRSNEDRGSHQFMPTIHTELCCISGNDIYYPQCHHHDYESVLFLVRMEKKLRKSTKNTNLRRKMWNNSW
ncbi:hypothetical protein CEXT_218891 [Caerostris extrusa]|uniref:Uncharacterized protein n=1 Tax=Caerostris extrusa TaxID=172846 RepID=A0AAV4T725_CAEEX|nr:hypothetical protein CEXT_218891 [Caerostris extrusa]